MRRVLAASPWGDPGDETPRGIVLAMRVAAAYRVASVVPAAGSWAAAATALLLAREVVRDGRPLPPHAAALAARVVGPRAVAARTLPELAAALSPGVRWSLADITSTDDLWRAEARWWTRVEQDGLSLARHGTPAPESLVGAVALLAVDAWRVRAALACAARGGASAEALDAVA